MVEIELVDTETFPWYQSNGISVRGYFIYQDCFLAGSEALKFLHKNIDKFGEEGVNEFILTINGCFNIIINKNDAVLCIADKIRSFPLFWKSLNEYDILVSDNINIITSDSKMDTLSIEEFANTKLFVTGNKTLFTNIYALQAGYMVEISKSNSEVEEKKYFEHQHKEFGHNKEAFLNAYRSTGKNMVKALNGRKAIIPLSGGADSRMILHMLKQENYNNILCFTYGKFQSKESIISKQVANTYGASWTFIDYSPKRWRELIESKEYTQYCDFSANIASLPHVQDFIAVKQLRDKNLIPQNSVFIPGHSGDFLAGSHIAPYFLLKDCFTKAEIVEQIKIKFYTTNFLSKELDAKVSSFVTNELYTNDEAVDLIENINRRERQAKYICNAVRVYEFWGYEWLLPLWDNNLFEFWSHVNIEDRYNRKLYFSLVENGGIRSTNDNSLLKTVYNKIKDNRIVLGVYRHMAVYVKYFTDPIYLTRVVSFKKYIYLVGLNSRFSPVYIINMLYRKYISDKYPG